MTDDTQPAPDRSGLPRPLLLHLSSIASGVAPAGASLAALQQGTLPLPPEAMAAIDREARWQMAEVLQGITRYRNHPATRQPQPDWALAREGSSQITAIEPDTHAPDSQPLLLVPSLVNSSDILDLDPSHSFARWLASQGHRVRLLDWGAPGELEARFDLGDLITGRLNRLVSAVAAHDQKPPILVGYCMGGVLALGSTLTLPPGAVGALVLLATPWDFHATDQLAADSQRIANLLGPLCAALPDGACLPGDVVQSLFWLLDPMTSLHKFRRFATMDPSGELARRFVLLEDWLNTPRQLPGPIARTCLQGWYGRNDLATGRAMLAGLPLTPANLPCPALCVIPRQDRIVPAASAKGLAAALPSPTIITPDLGHIGLITSRRAPSALWHQLDHWLKQQA